MLFSDDTPTESSLSTTTTTSTTTIEATPGKCPSSHPFAYWGGGLWCCATNKDLNGGPITLVSRHCENQANMRCPHGKCINNDGALNFF